MLLTPSNAKQLIECSLTTTLSLEKKMKQLYIKMKLVENYSIPAFEESLIKKNRYSTASFRGI
jgi:hypothetical protein